ncbi:hypothetical protein QJS04_geneDACA016077 [Acorus gramineus]|uniref:Uncharacterized protein n=1 Tax=Acorus gramineus TaxID=55184 RepID=A0AAV9BEM0_ACOGR|nr:hypothetical protein QJS04_geneDACA016077 [Acorus gramineus]
MKKIVTSSPSSSPAFLLHVAELVKNGNQGCQPHVCFEDTVSFNLQNRKIIIEFFLPSPRSKMSTCIGLLTWCIRLPLRRTPTTNPNDHHLIGQGSNPNDFDGKEE